MMRSTLVTIVLAVLAGPALAQTQPAPSPAGARPAAPAQPGGATAGRPGAPPGGAPGLPPLPAHLKNASTPKSPPPGMALGSASEGKVYLRVVLPFPRSQVDPSAGAGDELASYAQPFDTASVQAQTADGKKVAAADLERLLARETPVLVGFVPIPTDPVYLRGVKGETLLLLLPAPPGAPGAAPAPGAGGAAGRPAPGGARPAGGTTAPPPGF